MSRLTKIEIVWRWARRLLKGAISALTPPLACVEAIGVERRTRIRRFQRETTFPTAPTQANPAVAWSCFPLPPRPGMARWKGESEIDSHERQIRIVVRIGIQQGLPPIPHLL